MSTSPENNDPTDRTRDTDPVRDAGDAPSGAHFAAPDEATAGGAPPPEEAPAERDRPREEAFAEPRQGGILSAETFALTALALLAVTTLSTQLLQLFTSVMLVGDQQVPVDQVSQISAQVFISGTAAAITALVAGLSLVLAGAGTRPWARWAASAALIVSLLLVVLAVVTIILMPAGTEMQQPVF